MARICTANESWLMSNKMKLYAHCSRRGRYRLCEGVKHFGVSVEQWTKMRPEQRQKIVQRFNPATIEGSSASSVHTFSSPSIADEDTASSDQQPSWSVRCLKVSAEESGIHTIPLVTLQQIWSKASSLLQGENTITPVPGPVPNVATPTTQ